MSKSSVPCSSSIRSRSALVDILGVDHTLVHLECQGESTDELKVKPTNGRLHGFRVDKPAIRCTRAFTESKGGQALRSRARPAERIESPSKCSHWSALVFGDGECG